MNNKIKYLLITGLLILFTKGLNAQVIIGSDKTPETFSILEIDGKEGGLKIPRITDSDKTTMEASFNEEAKGLFVYNETSGEMEYWDGQKWITFSNNFVDRKINNGLTLEENKLKLGGSLINLITQIDFDNYNFNIKNSLSSQYIINDTMVVVNNQIINILPDQKFTVNDTVIDIRNKFIDIRPAELSINNNTFIISSFNTERIGINGSLIYKDGNEEQGYLLTCDEEGNAYWDALRPLGSIISGVINDNKEFTNVNTNITTSSLSLPPGQWLIIAKFTGVMTPAGTDGMYHWISLMAQTANTDNRVQISLSGINPEQKSTGSSYSSPSIFQYVNITEKTEYFIYANTSNTSNKTNFTTSDFGGSTFFAIRLDVPVNSSR